MSDRELKCRDCGSTGTQKQLTGVNGGKFSCCFCGGETRWIHTEADETAITRGETMSELRCPWCSGVAYVPSSPGDTVFRWWCRSSTNECNATGPERPTEAEARADCEVVMVDRELYGVLPDPISEVEIYRAAVALLVGDMAVEGEWPDPEAARKWALKEARALAAAVKEGE